MGQDDNYYASQPAPTQMMQVNGGNRNALNKPTNNKGDREWSHGFFDCFDDIGTCLIASCFPALIYSKNKSRLEHLEKHGSPHPNGGSMVGFDCCCHVALMACGCGWILQMNTRSATRTRYRIEGGGCGDCCAALCCTPCELTQGSREMELEENSIGKH